MDKINQYLDTVVAGIRDKIQHEEARWELEDHILEKYEEYLARGYSKEEAEERTVSDMGDAYDLRDQMGSVHSFVPRVFFHRASLVLLFGVLFSRFHFNIGSITLFPPIVGGLVMLAALYMFYPIGKKSKIAFWVYCAAQLIGVSMKFFDVTLILTIVGVTELFLPTIAMTLLCLELLQKDEEYNDLKWVIGIEWSYWACFLIAASKGSFAALGIMAFFVLIVVEVVLLAKYSRRAERYEWTTKRGLPINIPIVIAIVYAALSVFPSFIADYNKNYQLEHWVPSTSKLVEHPLNDIKFLELDPLDESMRETGVYGVQKYLQTEDMEKLLTCTKYKELLYHDGIYCTTVKMLAWSETHTYAVYFYYFKGDANFTCLQLLTCEGKRGTVKYENYYKTKDDEVYAYSGFKDKNGGEYSYALKNRYSFGYAIMEVEGVYDHNELKDRYQFSVHEVDYLHMDRVAFQDGWNVLFDTGLSIFEQL